jgi:signal transduction histidine kinase
VLRRDGSEGYLSTSVAPLLSKEGELEGAVVAFRDVSSEREVDRLKSDFVSMISHELRSPLANLSASIDLLSKLTSGQGDVAKALDIARANDRRLTSLVEDILSVSRLDAGEMRVSCEPVTLAPILKRLVRIAQAQTRRHKILLEMPDSIPFVLADPAKVEIVVNNLLTNAISYSPAGGRVLVKVGGAGGDQLTVSVIDEGVGIRAEHIEKVFSRFYRVDTSDGRKTYGHGLGLYISKRLIELQQGRIWVESRQGQGSCFAFSLPVVQEGDIAEEDLGTE